MVKKRILAIAFLLALSIAGQVLLRPCLGKTETEDIPQTTAESNSPQILDSDQDTETLQSDLWRTFFYMLGFVAMIGGGAWLVCRKFACGWKTGGSQTIRIKETVRMGPRKTLHLVQVANKTLLVGSGADSFTLLADVSSNLNPTEGGGNA